jgi:hypothetical protein
MSVETLRQSASEQNLNNDQAQAGTDQNAGNTGTANGNQQAATDQGAQISDELKEKIISEAIESGRVVDYETRFKPIYGSLKHTERELQAIRKAAPGDTKKDFSADLPKPQEHDFENYNDYVEALADYKAEVKLRDYTSRQGNQAAIQQQEEVEKKWDDQVTKALAKDPEFLEKGYIPVQMVDLLRDTEHLVDFAYHFGKTPAEAQRIMSLPPIQAAREIIKLETRFKEPPAKTTTQAPVNTNGVNGTTVIEKNPSEMTMAEYEAWRAAGGK